MFPLCYGRYYHVIEHPEGCPTGSKTLMGFLLDRPLTRPTESQGPDLNRGVVDLQSTAWPLRHLGKLCCLTMFSPNLFKGYTLTRFGRKALSVRTLDFV